MVKYFKHYHISLDAEYVDDDDPPALDCRQLLMNFDPDGDSMENRMDRRILYKITGRKRSVYDVYSSDEDEEYRNKYLNPDYKEELNEFEDTIDKEQ